MLTFSLCLANNDKQGSLRMDILFLIKQEQSKLQATLCSMMDQQDSGRVNLEPALADVDQYISLDHEFLYPELSGLLSPQHRFVNEGGQKHQVIKTLLANLKQELSEGHEDHKEGFRNAQNLFQSLKREVDQHIAYQQDQILPYLRSAVPTQDREDLGQVYLDLKEDMYVN